MNREHSWVRKTLENSTVAVLFLICFLVIISCIGEVTSRINVYKSIDYSIDRMYKKYFILNNMDQSHKNADVARHEVHDKPNETKESEKPRDFLTEERLTQIAGNDPEARKWVQEAERKQALAEKARANREPLPSSTADEVLIKIERLEDYKMILSRIEIAGCDENTGKTEQILEDIGEIRYGNRSVTIVGGSSDSWGRESYFHHIFNSHFHPRAYSTDSLLAILVVCSGTLSAIVKILLSPSDHAIRSIMIGMATGLIVYISLKGGKEVLFSLPSEASFFNPYTCAFVGFVAGMYSDKLYNAFSKMIDTKTGGDGANNPPGQEVGKTTSPDNPISNGKAVSGPTDH